MENPTKRIAFLVAVGAASFITSYSFAQTYVDVVHLHNGSIIRGIIVERVAGESLKIQTADGSVFVYAIDDVAKMVKEVVEAERPARPTGPKKNPASALAWSLVLGGLTPFDGGGQFYNGEKAKGGLFLEPISIIWCARPIVSSQGYSDRRPSHEWTC